MSPASTALGARLAALHAATFVGVGVYLPFFPVWLRSKALDPAVIGLIVAIPIMVRIVVDRAACWRSPTGRFGLAAPADRRAMSGRSSAFLCS